MKKVRTFLKQLGTARTISLFVTLFIVAAVPLTVLLSQQQQSTRSDAQTTPVPNTYAYLKSLITRTISLSPSLQDKEEIIVNCDSDLALPRRTAANKVSVVCGKRVIVGGSTPTPVEQPSPTAVPTNIPPVAGAVGKCGEPMDRWHPTVITQAFKDGLRAYYARIGQAFPYDSMTIGCATEHEHGDEPPSWIADTACNWSGFKDICDKYYVSYSGSLHGHPVSSSGPSENSYKHVSMKGFLANLPEKEPNGQSNSKRVDVYFRLHWSTNPFERNASYHSTEVWAKDSSGGVSHWQHWNFMGSGLCVRRNPALPCDTVRPNIFPVTAQSVQEGKGCEVWYSPEHASSSGGNWVWGMGLVVCDPVTHWNANEGSGDGSATKRTLDFTNPNDPLVNTNFWTKTGRFGVTRQMDSVAWYHPDSTTSSGTLRGRLGQTFWATQFGVIVNGPSDVRCNVNFLAKDGKTYKTVCLDQYVAMTMKQVSFPGNLMPLKTYPSQGVKIPN